MKELIKILQIIVSIILISLILMQKRGSVLSPGEFYPLRRGIEKKLFYLTIFFAIAFVALALLNLAIK